MAPTLGDIPPTRRRYFHPDATGAADEDRIGRIAAAADDALLASPSPSARGMDRVEHPVHALLVG